jgi:hypothetical protein
MCDAVQGEHIAQAVGCSCVRARTGARTPKGLLGVPFRLAERADRVRRGLIDTPRRRRFRSSDQSRESVWEEPGQKLGPGSRRKTLGGQSPREHPALGELNPVRSPGTPGRVKTQKPRPVGPAHRFGGGITDGKNGTWAHPRGNAADTFREEKAPQGESQERCRREIKPARARKE